MFTDFAVLLLFVVTGLLFVVVNILLSRFISWILDIRREDPRKRSSYECGERPIGDARLRFNPRFYIVALVFLIFDVEAIFLLPIAVVFQEYALAAVLGAGFFLGLLVIGLVYDWAHGDLDWVKPRPRFATEER